MIRIEVPGVPPSLNQMRNTHHFQWNRLKKEWAQTIFLVAARNKPATPLDQAIVTLTYHFRDRRRRDPDNYSGKFILDPLVELGFLVDDSFDHIELRHRQGKVDSKNPRVVICIEEAG
ncbi:Holliday junction resolvase RusA (prophage-encoded endonuclease) [Marininema mesophilum]|uniref:Holliday junction resolvase RusA (Prophage-encoded endonuclease) n=1 Tax=Marininema mesophilum TaxID=1048340 RepID=A0A1H3BVK7_9BACL|nr:RusA family crossover junction endodeoxyribonuclease [Marininema mesophilum]SDX45755.1 Holliday junction resolvase RusA (prophage-encoded endonuclease) [Marininema mesophilum]